MQTTVRRFSLSRFLSATKFLRASRAFAWSTILLSCLTASSLAQQAPYRYKLNTPYTYAYEQTITVVMDQGGEPVTITSEKSATFRIQFDSLRADSTLKGVISFDSAVVMLESPYGMGVQTGGNDLIGKQYWFAVNTMGDFVGMDTATKELEPLSQQLAASMPNILMRLNPDELKPGGSWRSTSEDTVTQEIANATSSTNSKFTVTGEKPCGKKKCLEIICESDVTGNASGNVQGQEFTVESVTKRKIVCLYDPERGVLVSSNTEDNGDQTVSAPADPNSPQTITSSSTSKITLVE